MDQVLEKLFESAPKAKILRLFLRNSDLEFTLQDIVKSTQLRQAQTKKEIKQLAKLGLVKQKVVYIAPPAVTPKKLKRKKIAKPQRKQVYYANQAFLLYPTLRDLVAVASQPSRKRLSERLKRLGKVKLVLISGVFINSDNSRADLLVVGDGIKRSGVEKFLADTEAEIGKSLNYVLMDTKEFRYRMDMYDRFLRDMLEFPHRKLINKLKL